MNTRVLQKNVPCTLSGISRWRAISYWSSGVSFHMERPQYKWNLSGWVRFDHQESTLS